MKLTKKYIMDNRSDAGGWSVYQLSIIGVKWPPKKGWIEDIIGKEITDQQAEMFEGRMPLREFKRQRNAKKLKKQRNKKKRNKTDFYDSKEWRRIRYKVLKAHGRTCMCCGRRAPDVEIHVDHIKPRSIRPDLELSFDNLQVLCKDCNLGKSNTDAIDYRPTV